MNRLCHTLLILLCAFGAFLILSDRSATAFQTQIESQRRGLSPEEKRGKAFYLRGESSSGPEITALMGEIEVPVTTLSCAGCHGARGEGKTEGGVTAGNLTWSHLTKPYGHTHESGRKHSAFSETSFVRTVTAGVDPAGNKLSVAMPTYRMPLKDMSDLLAYLKRIETDFDPGVSETSIVIGTLLPARNTMTGLAEAMGNVLQAYFAKVNNNGGIYNRKIELRLMHGDTTSTPSQT